ncbi:MAG: hypothetical protein RR420_06345 [Anaerovoracaceae bacterium]
MKEKLSYVNVIKFAGAYVAFIIGSGFATGQEIMQFYSNYGIWSIGAVLISMFLFSWVGGSVMSMGLEHRGEEKQVLTAYSAVNTLELFMNTSCQSSCLVLL